MPNFILSSSRVSSVRYSLDVSIMLNSASLLVGVVLASSLVRASSFYDNPEQDPIPKPGSPLEELEQKWSTDVSKTHYRFRCMMNLLTSA